MLERNSFKKTSAGININFEKIYHGIRRTLQDSKISGIICRVFNITFYKAVL